MKIGKYIRTISAVIGLVLALGAVGASDFHIIEIGQRDPGIVWVMMAIGAVLMLPLVIGKADKE